MRRSLALSLTLLLALALLSGGVVGCKRKTAGPVPAGDAESAVTTAPSSVATSESTSSDGTSGEVAESDSATNPPLPADAPPTKMKVKLYFGYEDRVIAVEREVPYSQAVAKTAMLELLKGPSATELKGLALHSEIPKGTKILGVVLKGHTARVDLSNEFDDGGGTLSMTMRLAQVVYTLAQYSTIDDVEFYMDGKRVQVFGGEGIELDSPQRPQDYYSLVPIDA